VNFLTFLSFSSLPYKLFKSGPKLNINYNIDDGRNVLGMKNANSTEMEPETGIPVVIEMPEHHTGQMGGTMRLGRRATIFQEGKPSILRKILLTELIPIFQQEFFLHFV